MSIPNGSEPSFRSKDTDFLYNVSIRFEAEYITKEAIVYNQVLRDHPAIWIRP